MSPPQPTDDAVYALSRRPGKFYVSRRFEENSESGPARPMRFAYQVFDAEDRVVAQSENGWEVVLRETPTRQQLKVLFFEDDRSIPRIYFQRFKKDGRPINRESFTLQGAEVEQLMALLYLVKRGGRALLEENQDGLKLTAEALRELLEDSPDVEEDLRALFEGKEHLLQALIESDVLPTEVIEYGKRKEAVQLFGEMLNDESLSEQDWQTYFEKNPWVLGAGLAPQFLHSFRPGRLEQTIIGASVGQGGRRVDALMRTAGHISALVLVEIKKHTTKLLADEKTPYRKAAWRMSPEVAGGVAQCQAAVHSLTDRVAESREFRDLFPDGTEAEWAARVCRPRSLLVVGSLTEFEQGGHLHKEKYESFERFRRSLTDPEIVTFDELYERAALWLELSRIEESEKPTGEHKSSRGLPPWGEEAPFENLTPPPEEYDEAPLDRLPDDDEWLDEAPF